MAPLTLYTWKTPNGWKNSIHLEELGLEYKVEAIDIDSNRQKEDWYLRINPNGRIPALVDHQNGDFNVFETGSILWYVSEKYDKEHKFWPKDFNKQSEVMSWLMFQMGGVGPMQGQAHHFVRYAKPRLAYPMHRYVEEAKRLYQVLDSRLADHEYLAADQYTIADIANFSWVAFAPWGGIDRKSFPNLNRWFEKIAARPAVKKGLAVPLLNANLANIEDKAKYDEMLSSAHQKIQDAEKNPVL